MFFSSDRPVNFSLFPYKRANLTPDLLAGSTEEGSWEKIDFSLEYEIFLSVPVLRHSIQQAQ